MKACVLYSGGKDSSLIAILLKRMGFDVELRTANFGVYESYIPASLSAKSLNFPHRAFEINKNILNNAIDIILKDGFPNNGISYLHKEVIEEIAKSNSYKVIADGTRRDDKTPKLNKNEIRSLEDRYNIQYINLDSFGYKTIEFLVSNLFEIIHEKSNKENSSDYEVEIRTLIDKEYNKNSEDLFPEHYQTRVVGLKNKN
ncbi:MAG: hypothetical protein LBM26_01985 [Methanobrevibacter sp.]|jgi:predicted subunit of tRNA(5-methylaminomethyl-2-thiouridylate) methyltransferase|nr:hypothetical protein [Methanobrevibacter sp.]